MKCIKDHSLFATDQSHDLLNIGTIGQRNFLHRISVVILKEPSVQASIRRHHLRTFSERKRNTRKISQLERDKRLILSTMRKKDAVFETN